MSSEKKNLKILLVDDKVQFRTSVGRVLYEYDVHQAGNGAEALEVLRGKGPFHAVISDWDMPVMSGLELLKEIRGDEALKEMPVIMVTAHPAPDAAAQLFGAGASEYLKKPADLDVFFETIERVTAPGWKHSEKTPSQKKAAGM